MAVTPEEWFPILAARLDRRQPRIRTLRRYSSGDAPLPELGKNTKASWEAFQKKARTDMGGLVCQSLGGRIVPNGVFVGDSTNTDAVQAARQVWRDNRLDVVFADAVADMLSVSVGYLMTGVRDGLPVITAEKPEQMITAGDPAQPWRARAALKAWRDKDDGNDYAIVMVPGMRQRFVRKSTNDTGTPFATVVGDTWEPMGEPDTFDGPVPVFVLDNRDGKAEFEPHIDVIDRINLGKLQRMVVTAMQAFKQRAMKGGLESEDEDGNTIDWAKVFEPAPGALWDLPEGIDVWESSETDIRPLLEGEKADARDFAAVTQTPISVFIPDSTNQSAEGAANAQRGEIAKAKDRIARVKPPMAAALLQALRILGMDDGSTVDVRFEPAEHVSFTEKTTAAVAAKASGRSQRWIAENIFGMTPDEFQQDQNDLAAEQLQQSILIGAGNGSTIA